MSGPAAGRLLLFLFLAGLPAPPGTFSEQGTHPLYPFTADYRLTRDGVPVGHTRVSLELLPEGGYLYRARTEPNAVISLVREELILEESRGRIVNGQPRPDYYRYRREGSDPQRSLQLDFDWRRRQVHMEDENSSWHMEIEAETLDKLVQQLVFTLDLGQGGDTVSYRVADGGRLKEYVYQVQGKERVITPLGRFDTLKVDRAKEHGTSDYTLWLAPALDHRPVRILRRHQSTLYRMDLVEFEREVIER